MKSAEEKALEVFRSLNLPATESGVAYRKFLDALQEHERDTRHACAEAVMALPRWEVKDSTLYDAINPVAAYSACMNMKVE